MNEVRPYTRAFLFIGGFMYNKTHKTVEELIQIFLDRGMKFHDIEKAKNRLSHINYYKIKEFASLFYKEFDINGKKEYKYDNVFFEYIITRFYQDKNMRVYLLHAIEKVELSFKTKLAYVLGERYEAFGYLQFKNWCNKNKYCRYYIEDKEKEIKKYLKILMNREDNQMIKEFFKQNPDCDYPPIWMLIEILTFGEALKFYNLMSEKNRKAISNFYDCTPSELEGWLKALKFIRNLSAHNINVIDSKLITNPPIRNEWKKYLYTDSQNRVSNKIALIIFILFYMIKKINPDYGFGNFRNIFVNLFSNKDINANRYGFASKDLKIFSKNFTF